MNEWGLPDWRDAAAYGDVKRWTFNRWRWEFYRRRDDLRACFDARAEETYRHHQQYAGRPGFPVAHLRPDEPGFRSEQDEDALYRFGYLGLPNPRISEQPEWAIEPRERDGTVWFTKGSNLGVGKRTIADLLRFAGVELTNEQEALLRHALAWQAVPLDGAKIAVTFDLDKPLKRCRWMERTFDWLKARPRHLA
jgi:hypothetical protein